MRALLLAAAAVLAAAGPGLAEPPRALARSDALVERPGRAPAAKLDARASWDPHGRALTYSWRAWPSPPEEPSAPVTLVELPATVELVVTAGGEASQPARLSLPAMPAQRVGSGAVGPSFEIGRASGESGLRGPEIDAAGGKPGPVRADASTDFVQLYDGTRPLAPAPARLAADGTALIESVTLRPTTTNGTVLTLERVREDGQFFFPHEVLRTYTVRISATVPQQIVLGDPGVLFVHPAVIGTQQNVLVALGNRVPAQGDQPPRGGQCALGGEAGSADVLAWVALMLVVAAPRRRRREFGDTHRDPIS